MGTITDNVIVLKRSEWSESSYIVRCVSREYGLVSFVAKGARRPKSTLFGLLEPGSVVKAHWYTGKSSDLMTLTEVFESKAMPFTHKSLEHSAILTVLLETMLKLQPIGFEDAELFTTLEKSIYWIEEKAEGQLEIPNSFLSKFWLRCVRLQGFYYNAEYCGECRKPLKSPVRFRPTIGGFVCLGCHGDDYEIIEEEWLLNDGISIDDKKTWRLIENVILNYMKVHLPNEFTLKSIDYMNQVRNLENGNE